MSGNRRSKKLIAAILCMAMTGSILAYLPNEVSAQTSAEVVNGSFEVGYAGMDVYGWHLTAMTDELAEGIQTDANATIQSLEAYTLKAEESENTDRSKVAALTKYGKGTVAMTSQAFAITGGERYTVSYDAVSKGWTPTAPGVQVAVKEMTADGTLVKWTIPTTDSTDAGDMTTNNAVVTYPTTEWTTITRTFVANDNATQAELYIWVGAEDDMTGTILFDKVAVSVFQIETDTTPENPISSMLEGGDANYDSESNASGNIDICDVIHMKKYLADEDVVVSNSADMNQNELVNEDDLTLLRWKLLGVTTTAAAEQVGIRTDLSNQLTAQAQTLVDSIYALPSVGRLQGFNGSPIQIANNEFATLDNQVKVKVSNRKTLTALESAYDATYKMIYDMSTDVSKFSEHSSYQYEQVTLAATPEDSEYGKVLTANCTNNASEYHVVLQYDNPDDLAEQLSGYDKVCFYIWNGRPSNASVKSIMHDFGGEATTPDSRWSLPSQTWTKIELTVDEFVNSSYFGIYEANNSGSYSFKFTSIWAEKDNSAEEAKFVIEMIDSLPKTSELEGYHKDKIIEARKAYNALSDEAKAKVSNYEILTSLESVYDATYKMIYDMSTDVSKFSEHSSYQYEQVTLAATPEDSEYGKVLTANCTNNGSEYHVVLQYDNPDDLAEQLSGYDKVCFYIWNGRPSGASAKKIMHDFGGEATTPDSRWSLPSQTWTKIELTVDEFVNSSYFGLYEVSNSGSYSFKFTSIWAESEAQSVIKMIDSLPQANELEGYHGTVITEARKTYNALSDEAKAKVSNYETLQSLESAYNTTYKMIYDMSTDVSKFSKHSSYDYQDVTLDTNPGDSEYGKVLTANCTNKHGEYHVVLQYDNPSNLAEQLSGYDKVCFYIWNGRPSGASAKSIMHDFGGVSKTPDNRWSLPSQTWTKIELTVDEFVKSTYFGLYAVSNQGSYSFKFTSIWAEKGNSEEVQHVIEMIDALPNTNALEGYHKDVITKARQAYNALSDEAKAKVSNYATLQLLESAYNAKYKMIYDMSTDVSKFSEHSSYQYEQVTLAATPEDSEYGKTLTANCTNNGSEYHVVLQYDKPSDLAEQLSGYDKVCFYIWNGRPSGASVKSIMHDFGGVSKTPDNRWSLPSQTWTKIELTVDEFVKSTYFGLYAVSNQGSYSFKFTSIWAEKAQ